MSKEKALELQSFFTEAYTLKDLDFDVNDYIDLEEMETFLNFDDIFNTLLYDKNAFDTESETIYYSNAIQYLSENDNSLTESLEIATDLGYSISQLNSEILASLLKNQKLEEKFLKLRDGIETILESN